MGTYKGNGGHLMQHWTLCELLSVASNHVAGLNYIDAYAMAPWATQRTSHSLKFDSVRDGLPSQGSAYENAWHNLVNQHQNEGYPSSAAFVREVWNGQYSLLLCETDTAVADEIDRWLACIRHEPGCEDPALFRGDWRARFADPLPNPRDAGLPEDFLTLVSFDPNMYYPQPPADASPTNLYPCDLERTLAALKERMGSSFNCPPMTKGIVTRLHRMSSLPRSTRSLREKDSRQLRWCGLTK